GCLSHGMAARNGARAGLKIPVVATASAATAASTVTAAVAPFVALVAAVAVVPVVVGRLAVAGTPALLRAKVLLFATTTAATLALARSTAEATTRRAWPVLLGSGLHDLQCATGQVRAFQAAQGRLGFGIIGH